MKTLIKSIDMKKFTITLILGIAGLFCSTTMNAQSEAPAASLLSKSKMTEDSVNSFISFSPVFVEGKTYVRWLVKNDKKDGLFVIERSDDGIDFEALGFKDRIGTQLLVNLFYSFVDEEPFQGESFYRIMQVGADNTYRYSDIVKVKTDAVPSRSGNSATAPASNKQ